MEKPQSPVKWEKVHIFISSTFNDMHSERDYLVKQVFPRLAEWCERRRLRLVEIDLRWGITEADATNNKNVVSVCLNQIDKCRPFFICFFGQRYGWVPTEDDVPEKTFQEFPRLKKAMEAHCSVTVMEIIHALLRPLHSDETTQEKGYSPATASFCYFRRPSYLENFPTVPDDGDPVEANAIRALRRVYTDEALDDQEERENLLNLRKKILRAIHDTGRPIRPYQATWDPQARTPELETPLNCPSVEKQNVASWRKSWARAIAVELGEEEISLPPAFVPNAETFNRKLTAGRLVDFKCEDKPLGEVILRDLKGAIEKRYPDHVEVESEDALQKEIDQQEQFLFAASEGFIERGDDFTELDRYVDSDSRALFVLTAPGGVGKSTLLANWVDRYRQRKDRPADHTIHFRFIGASDGSTVVSSMLRFLLRELKEVAHKFEDEIPDDPTELMNRWSTLLAAAGKTPGKTVIVLDALNQLESGLDNLKWVPRRLPENVKLIVSFKTGYDEAKVALERLSAAGPFVHSQVKPFDREEDRKTLIQTYLKQYVKQLDEHHIKDLVKSQGASNPLYLKVILSELRVFGAFAKLQDKIRQDFGHDPISAFEGVLARLEREPAYSPIDPGLAVPIVFGLLVHARHGLSVDELASMLRHQASLGEDEKSRRDSKDTVLFIFRQVRPFLARREGRHDFFFESFRIATSQRYAAIGQEETGPVARLPGDYEKSVTRRLATEWHRMIADYFQSAGNPKGEPAWSGPVRALSELSWHLAKAGMGQVLIRVLTDPAYLEAKAVRMGVHSLLEDFGLGRAGEGSIAEESRGTMEAMRRALGARLLMIREQLEDMLWHIADAVSAEAASDPVLRSFIDRVDQEMSRPGCRPWLKRQRSESERGRSPLTLMFAHTGSVTSVRYSPDGSQITAATDGYGGYAVTWDTRTGHEISRFPGGGSVCYSPDGSQIACASRDGTVNVWDVKSGLEIGTPRRLPWRLDGQENSVCLSADASRIVTVAINNFVRVWDRATQREIATLEGNSKDFACVSCSCDGTLIASGSEDNSVKVWDARGGRECGNRKVKRSLLPGLGYVASPGHQLGIFHGHTKPVCAVCFSPDAILIASASKDTTIRVWDRVTNGQLATLKGHSETVCAVSFSPDGTRIVSGSEDNTVKVWDVGTGGLIRTFEGHGEPVVAVCYSSDGTAIVSGSADKTVRVWDAEGGSKAAEVKGHSSSVNCVCFSPDGTTLASGSDDRTVRVWDVNNGRLMGCFKGHSTEVCSVEYSLDGFLVVSGDSDGTVKVWDRISAEEKASFDGNVQDVWCVRFSPDGSLIASGSYDGAIKVWDRMSSHEVAELKGHLATVLSVCFSPDGSHLASGSEDSTIRVWDVKDGRERGRFEGHSSWVYSVSYSPNGSRLASASRDGTARVWNVESGQEVAVLGGHSAGVQTACYSSNGLWIVSGGADGLFILWDATTFEPIARGFVGSPVKAVRFFIDNPNLLGVADDGSGSSHRPIGHVFKLVIPPPAESRVTFRNSG